MRKMNDRELIEAKNFVLAALAKRYGQDAGWLTIASHDLKMNYSQLVNIVGGRTKPTKALLKELGYVHEPFVSPLGNPYILGEIIEVEVSRASKDIMWELRNVYPEYDWEKQKNKVFSAILDLGLKHLKSDPGNWLEIRAKTPEEQASYERSVGKGASRPTKDPDFVPDIDPGDEFYELDVMG